MLLGRLHYTEFLLKYLCLFIVVLCVSSSSNSFSLWEFANCKNDSIPANQQYVLDQITRPFTKFSLEDGSYKYEIVLCPKTIQDTVAVQQTRLNVNPPVSYSLGAYSDMQVVFGKNWILLDYYNGTPYGGEKYNKSCSGYPRRSMIVLACDYKATQAPSIIAESKYKEDNYDDCYYLFQVADCNVCEDDGCSSLTNRFSPGSIILIVCFSVTGAYLLFGALFQGFCRGARGWDLIPNKAFWQELGALQSDGCAFACKCSNRDSTYSSVGETGGAFGSTAQPTNHRISSSSVPVGNLMGDDDFEDDQLLAP